MPHFEFANYQGVPLFIYGTLKSGHRNRRVISPYIDRCAKATALDCSLASEDEGLPIMFRSAGAKVIGELVHLNPDVALNAAANLDRFEGCPYMYNRELVDVEVDGEVVKAWAYTYGRPIPAGFKPNPISEWRGA